jgi:hypothetical protein
MCRRPGDHRGEIGAEALTMHLERGRLEELDRWSTRQSPGLPAGRDLVFDGPPTRAVAGPSSATAAAATTPGGLELCLAPSSLGHHADAASLRQRIRGMDGARPVRNLGSGRNVIGTVPWSLPHGTSRRSPAPCRQESRPRSGAGPREVQQDACAIGPPAVTLAAVAQRAKWPTVARARTPRALRARVVATFVI